MPIDFAAIADQYRPLLQQQLRTATTSFARIGTWLKKVLPAAEAAERNTRDIPIILFRSGALMATVDASQWGTLGIGLPRATLWNRIAEGGRRFWRGLGLIPHMAREEMILPRTYGVLRDTIDLILSSVERYLPLALPGQNRPLHLFNLDRPGQASDVFGGGALLGYTYLASRRGLDRLVADATALKNQVMGQDWRGLVSPVREAVGEIIAVFRPPDPNRAPTSPPATSESATSMPLPMLLQTIVEGIVGAIMILPMLPNLVAPMIEAVFIRGRVLALEQFESLEQTIFGVRRSIINVFAVRLPAFGTRLYDLLVVTDYVLLQHLAFYTDFAIEYVVEFYNRFHPYLRRLSQFMLTVVRFADALRRMWEMVMNFDLVPLLLQMIGIPPSILALLPSPPRLTVGMILEALAYGTVTTLFTSVAGWLTLLHGAFVLSAPGLADRLAGSPIARRILAARNVAATAAVRLPRSYAARPRPTAAPGPLPLHFPNLATTLTGGPVNVANLRIQLAILGLRARTSTMRILTAGALALDQSAVAFDEAAREATRLGDPARYRAILAWSDQMGDVLYGDQVRALQSQVHLASFGHDYDAFLARRGFELLEAAIPLYIDAMRGYWRERVLGRAEGRFAPLSGLPPYELPTSPHILDRRARLGRVRLPRLTIRAADRPMSRDLAEAVAAHFKTEVERAYAQGLDQLPD